MTLNNIDYTMIVLTKFEPEYALKNQMIGVKIDLENKGNEEKESTSYLYLRKGS